jgi:hypothetical protein
MIFALARVSQPDEPWGVSGDRRESRGLTPNDGKGRKARPAIYRHCMVSRYCRNWPAVLNFERMSVRFNPRQISFATRGWRA